MKKYYSCGSGGSATLLTGNTEDINTFVEVFPSFSLSDLSLSGSIASGVSEEGDSYVWGPFGFLLLLPQVQTVSCGWTHVLVLSGQSVYVFGKGSHGQLGLADRREVSEATLLEIDSCTSVACGFRTSFVITSSGVYCFGENRKFQLGNGHNKNVNTPTLNTNLPLVRQIAAGNKHGIAFNDSNLYVWGSNAFGQLSLDVTEISSPSTISFGSPIAKIDCGWYFSGILTAERELFMTGKGDFGQLGTGRFEHLQQFTLVERNVEDFDLGSEHTLIIKDGIVRSWGWNEHGNLGDGSNSNSATPVELNTDIKNPRKVRAGAAMSFVIAELIE